MKDQRRAGSSLGFHHSPFNCPLTRSNSFRITYIRKNAPASPYGSHISKTKDLKPFRITYLQKKGGWFPHPANTVIPSILAGDEGSQRSEGREPQSANHESPVTNHESLPLSALTSTLTKNASATPLTSTLTKTKDLKSFIINTYKKGVGQGPNFEFRISSAGFHLALATGRRFPILLGFSRP